MLISDFSVEMEPAPVSSAKNENWEKTLAQNKDFRKLKEYIENLKIELYSQESTVSTLKEKLRISETRLCEERATRSAQVQADKEGLLAQKKEWQAKVDRLLEEKRAMSLKCEETVEYVDRLVKSKRLTPRTRQGSGLAPRAEPTRAEEPADGTGAGVQPALQKVEEGEDDLAEGNDDQGARAAAEQYDQEAREREGTPQN